MDPITRKQLSRRTILREARTAIEFVTCARILSVASALAQSPSTTAADREARWREDLQFFASELARGQKDFSKVYPPAPFNETLASLQADILRISDTEIVFRLKRLIATANIGHNSVYLSRSGLGFVNRLPLTLQWYPDGLAVVGASSNYAEANGARVLKLGDMTADQLLAALAPYISHENDVWLREQSPGLMVWDATLRYLSLLGPDNKLVLTLVGPGSDPFTITVSPEDPGVAQISLNDTLHVPRPLFLTQTPQSYWYRYLADSQTLYIQYIRCVDDPAVPFADFARRLLADADSHPIRRVVIDLRLNSGGASHVIDPLIAGLKSRLKNLGHVYVLVGPRTFSSALLNALQLRLDLRATLAGETGGEKLNGYGEVKSFNLPNSGVTVQYTTKYFRMSADATGFLEPDLAVPRTFVDALAGRDPVLEAVLKR